MVSYPYRFIFPPLVGHPVRSFFQWGVVFLRHRPRGRTCCVGSQCVPPSLWGGFRFQGGRGCFRVCLPPVGYAARLSGGVLGFPIPAQSGVFLPCPDRALFHPPTGGGVHFLWIVARRGRLSLWYGKAQSGRLSRRIGKECREWRRCGFPLSVCPCAA